MISARSEMRELVLVLAALLVLCSSASVGVGAELSFESGADVPEGWWPGPGAMRATRYARTGARSLGATTRSTDRSWSSYPVPLEVGQAYRLGGWIRCREGVARLGMDLLDEAGRVIGSARTPPVVPAQRWQYVAAEADLPPRATSASLWFEVEGEAYLDDVVFAPIAANLAFNPSFEGDAKGRVGYWSQETRSPVPGPGAGALRADAAGGRTGGAMLLEAESGWYAARMVDMPLPQGYTLFRFSGWSRADAAELRLWVVWVNAWGKVIGADHAARVATEQDWARWECRVGPPAGAVGARLVVAVRGGRAWLDDFRFSLCAPATRRHPVVRVHVNQVGYELKGPKSLVVATNFFPTDSAQGELEIRSESGRPVVKLPLRCSGRIHEGQPADWGDYYWRADFSSLTAPGRYRAAARFGARNGTSPPFEIGRDLLLRRTADLGVKFFFVQRCGFDVPGWHRACHLDDARLPDGTHINATGGWHSAGDYNKIMYENGDGGVAYALLQAHHAAPEIFARFDRNGDGTSDVLDEATWGARFVAKMQIPESGGLYGTISQGPGRAWTKWSPPEVHTDNIIGTDDDPVVAEGEGSSPLVIGAWARLSAMPELAAAADDYLRRAVKLFDHATQGATSSGSPHLLLSAMDLHAVTGERRYLDFARDSAEAIMATQQPAGRLRGAFGSYGEISAGALATFALNYPDDPVCARIRAAMRPFVRFCLSTADNPFGLSKQAVGQQDYFFEPTSTLGHNFECLGRAWAAAQIHHLIGDRRALRFAADQIDWVLGKNPIGLCMFEGKGTFNPPRYHHRYDAIAGRPRGAVPGAIPNGFVRSAYGLDQPGFDLSRVGSGRDHPSYRTSEPWLTHNMWYLMALSALPRKG
ncbi:MAG: glycoside hydrolase family 9 protein [Armatimonadota bacterium]|nr:MAG: glycoside hydrolase family 9 protein [Armatimonadota bacterium]